MFVSTRHTPQETMQFSNMYSGLLSHWPVAAQKTHSLSLSIHARVVDRGLVVVAEESVLVVAGLMVMVVVVVTSRLTQIPHEARQNVLMKDGFFSHSLKRAQFPHSSLSSTHGILLVLGGCVVVVGSLCVSVEVVIVTSVVAADVKPVVVGSEQNPQDIRQKSSMKDLFLSHSPNSVHSAHSSCKSSHTSVVLAAFVVV